MNGCIYLHNINVILPGKKLPVIAIKGKRITGLDLTGSVLTYMNVNSQVKSWYNISWNIHIDTAERTFVFSFIGIFVWSSHRAFCYWSLLDIIVPIFPFMKSHNLLRHLFRPKPRKLWCSQLHLWISSPLCSHLLQWSHCHCFEQPLCVGSQVGPQSGYSLQLISPLMNFYTTHLFKFYWGLKFCIIQGSATLSDGRRVPEPSAGRHLG